MHSVQQAIILLAGRARRMKHYTQNRPKCLLEIDDKSILHRSLNFLCLNGISNIVLVVGYKADQIKQVIGNNFQGMDVKYVDNDRYFETNTAYSLWLAREYLSSETLILEGDIVFDDNVLLKLISEHREQSAWAAVPISPQRSEGILLSCNDLGYVANVELIRDLHDKPADLNYKCAGIQLLTEELAKLFAQKLSENISNGEIQKYADLVLKEVLTKSPMFLFSLERMRWVEVDSPDDFQFAKRIFHY